MKKLAKNLLILPLLFASIAVHAIEVRLGRQLGIDELRPGVVFVLANPTTVNSSDPCSTPNGSYLQGVMSNYSRSWAGTGLNVAPGLSEDNLWTLVEAPEQEQGDMTFPSFYLQHVLSGAYVTGSSASGSQKNYLTDKIEDALPFALEGRTTQSVQFKNEINEKTLTMVHYEGDFSKSFFGACWSYGFAAYINNKNVTVDTYMWNVFALDRLYELNQLIEQYTEMPKPVGTGYGCYTQQAVNLFKAAIGEARRVVSSNASDEECDAALVRLKAAYDRFVRSRVRLADGYYQITNHNEMFVKKHGAPVALRADKENMLYWTVFDNSDPRFVFKLTWAGVDDDYIIESWPFGTYWGGAFREGQKYVCLTATPEVKQVVTPCDDGSFQFKNAQGAPHYYTSCTGDGSKIFGHVSFSSEDEKFNHWDVVPADVEALKNSYEVFIQNDRAQIIKEKAIALYGKTVGLVPTDEGLIKRYADKADESDIYVSNVRRGSIANLGDNNPETTITIEATSSSLAVFPNFIVNLGEDAPRAFSVGVLGSALGLLPQTIVVYGRQSDDQDWLRVTRIDSIKIEGNAWRSDVINAGTAYKQLCFEVRENQGLRWTYGFPNVMMGGFQLYSAAESEDAMAKRVPGMDKACESVWEELANVNARMAEGTLTNDEVEALECAVEVLQTMVDSVEIRQELGLLIEDCDSRTFKVGTALGEFDSQAVSRYKAALLNARLAYNRNASGETLAVRLEALKAALKDVWSSQVGSEKLLTGKLIASDYSMQSLESAFDNDPTTTYRSLYQYQGWVGMELADSAVVTRVGYRPASESPSSMIVGVFEGARNSDFSDALPLHIIPGRPSPDGMTYADVKCTRAFKYVRYVSPSDGYCRLADIAFYGRAIPGSDSVLYQATEVPLVIIRTEKGEHDVNHDIYSVGTIDIISDDGTTLFSDSMQVRGRGNGSWTFPQKPMKFKLFHKAHVLGMPAKAKKWTLVNNYRDKTFIRNPLTFEIGRMFGMPYTPATQCVDVVFNGEYKGSFLLGDQVEVKKNRVPVTEMTKDDNTLPNLSGGYLIELDGYAGSEPKHFYTNILSTPISLKYPDEDDITPEQWDYVRQNYNEMEALIMSTDYRNPAIGYRSRLDIQSFLRRFIVEEYSGNYDAYHSVHMFKDRNNDLWYSSPLWDFDLAMDNCSWNYPTCGLSNYLSMSRGGVAGARTTLDRIIPDNEDLIREIWSDARYRRNFTVERMYEYVDSMAAAMDRHQALHFQRWPILNTVIVNTSGARGSYKAEVEFLKGYLKQRMDWMDNKIGLVVPAGVESATVEATGRIVGENGQLVVGQFPEGSKCQVVTIEGQTVLEMMVGEASVSRKLPAGIYAVKVTTPSGESAKRKVMIE